MKSNFQKCLDWVLVHEGGFSDHPADPGGATMKGVTQKTYNAWRRGKGRKLQSVRNITKDEIRSIYYQNYWIPAGCDQLSTGLDYCQFDFAVNSGVSRASRFLQAVVGVKRDGVVGVQTLAAVKQSGSINVITAVCNRRMRFLRGLKHWRSFKNGWTRRVLGEEAGQQDFDIGVIDRAVLLAKGDVTLAPTKPAPGRGEGRKSLWYWLTAGALSWAS